MTNPHVIVRDLEPDDVAFVTHSWLKSYRESPWARRMRNKTYFDEHHPIVTRMLVESTTLVACMRDARSQIAGYLCGERPVNGRGKLHYVYTKGPFRQFGVARTLLDALGVRKGDSVSVTHWTPNLEWLFPKGYADFNPYHLGGDAHVRAVAAAVGS